MPELWTGRVPAKAKRCPPRRLACLNRRLSRNSRRPLLNWTERLEFDLCPQLHDALGRNLEVIRRADGIAPHEGV